MVQLSVNNETFEVECAPETPLLWALREHLGLTGTRFGCGAGMCGACTVHIDGEAAYACQLSVEAAAGHRITTIEGLSENADHPLQRAWVAEQVPQCGYCQSGQIMRAASLLARNPAPNREDIRDEMSANLCRCGTYPRILRAIERAVKEA
ncbi:(2Fe-2S)-binding protein [Denitrobaculum tricleocarpae]|uniref:(2Fe-2S)-binding protein n=1 Tax=Denitrobaculum tricleocarpae TaxID=2591009 RepID=A0A545TF74_9PROT|nr:(2Fe-2S)-binding protein [Denitrobaculum tricleocarpae]TQV75816.1 (2Fe-2S)-binding protein [Denitrobaculum tricleocarpae]